jgi:hypothetical protein
MSNHITYVVEAGSVAALLLAMEAVASRGPQMA